MHIKYCFFLIDLALSWLLMYAGYLENVWMIWNSLGIFQRWQYAFNVCFDVHSYFLGLCKSY
jgi:hypothetical protein